MLKCPGIKLTNLYTKMQKSLEVSGIGNHIYLYEMEIYISINNIFIEKIYIVLSREDLKFSFEKSIEEKGFLSGISECPSVHRLR